jgi:Protein of unknown function (DUF3987)
MGRRFGGERMTALSIERGRAVLDANSNGAGVLIGLKGLNATPDNDSGIANALLSAAISRTTLPSDVQTALVRVAETTLQPTAQAAPEYPIDALGPLAAPCRAIAYGGQLDAALVGQSLLATAALLTQSVRVVQTLDGTRGLNLYVLTTGLSGDGKSTAERVALQAVRAWQSTHAKQYRDAVTQAQGAPKAEQQTPLRAPYRVMSDATVEGIRRSFSEGLPSQGVFTSEAAAILSGYGMTAEHRSKTAATFNGLWDAGTLSVARGTAGRVELYDRRLSAHWMIQPDAVRETLNDRALSAIGFWPRFLLATPSASAPRTANRFQPETNADIRQYWQRCTELLELPIGEDCSDLVAIAPDTDAFNIAGQFFERMEIAAKTKGGALESVRPFAVRATEQMFRVAGVLAAFPGHNDLTVQDVRNAIALVSYSLDCWRSALGSHEECDETDKALQLFRWLVKQPGVMVKEAAILQLAPKALRSRTVRDNALMMLDHHGLIARDGDVWRIGQSSKKVAPWN